VLLGIILTIIGFMYTKS